MKLTVIVVLNISKVAMDSTEMENMSASDASLAAPDTITSSLCVTGKK